MTAAALLFAAPVRAEHAMPGAERPWYDIDANHTVISNEVEFMARELDAFFGGELTYEESTGSYMKISGGTTWSEGGNTDYNYAVRLKLTLPNTRKRYKLILDSEPGEDDEGDTAPSGSEETLSEAVDESNYQLALRYMARASETVQLTVDAGVRLRWTPDPFVRVRARRSWHAGEWEIRGIEKLEYSVDDHFEATTRLEFDRRLWTDYLYRNYAFAKFGSDEDRFELGTGVILFQQLSSRDAMTYQAGIRGESHPLTCITSFDAGITYRRRLYRKWLFGSLTPAVTWPRDDNFSPLASVAFKLEMIFGSRALGASK
jgi:hypothetical protein